MKRHYTFTNELPGSPFWAENWSPAAKAKRELRDRERQRIMEEARAKGWEHWQGKFFYHLEKKLRAIGCPDPSLWTDELRQERTDELEWEAKHKNA